MTHRSVLASLLLLSIVSVMPAYAGDAHADHHVMLSPSEMVWGDGPGSLPPGSKMAVLAGDPGKEGLFIVRLKFPAGYKIPAHWHPVDEHVTVMSGTFWMGMGDKLDESQAKSNATGSFMKMPATARHYAFAKEEAIIQLTAMGPFVITYVNPSDDPRKPSMQGKMKNPTKKK